MLQRVERSPNLAAGSTPNTVGPGSYTDVAPRTKSNARPNFTPFLSTAKRGFSAGDQSGSAIGFQKTKYSKLRSLVPLATPMLGSDAVPAKLKRHSEQLVVARKQRSHVDVVVRDTRRQAAVLALEASRNVELRHQMLAHAHTQSAATSAPVPTRARETVSS
jgi:hypothetical protein